MIVILPLRVYGFQLEGQLADHPKLGKQKSPLALKSGDLGSRPVTVTLGKTCLASETQFPHL